jgi:S-DNA-T family DNA segregation ATPase FtsK/SpoIIIE
MSERGAVVEEEKKRVDEHQPIHIEMPLIEVARSTRAREEKQTPLFADMPDSPLPPLHLLDQVTQHVES